MSGGAMSSGYLASRAIALCAVMVEDALTAAMSAGSGAGPAGAAEAGREGGLASAASGGGAWLGLRY